MPPATIRIKLTIARVYLRCMAALLCPAVQHGSGLILIFEGAYPKAKGAQARVVTFHIAVHTSVDQGSKKFRHVECALR